MFRIRVLHKVPYTSKLVSLSISLSVFLTEYSEATEQRTGSLRTSQKQSTTGLPDSGVRAINRTSQASSRLRTKRVWRGEGGGGGGEGRREEDRTGCAQCRPTRDIDTAPVGTTSRPLLLYIGTTTTADDLLWTPPSLSPPSTSPPLSFVRRRNLVSRERRAIIARRDVERRLLSDDNSREDRPRREKRADNRHGMDYLGEGLGWG